MPREIVVEVEKTQVIEIGAGGAGSGQSGYSGVSGYSGTSGYSGYSGVGVAGISGYSGYSGLGISGYSGYSGPNEAILIGYSNPGVPYDNVQEALDALFYVPPSITSLTNNVGTVEKGVTVTAVTLNWAYNKTMVSASLTDVGPISPLILTYPFTGLSLTSDKTYTLTAGDGINTTNRSTTVAFRFKRYWGSSPSDNANDATILGFSQEFASGRQKGAGGSWLVNGNGQYIYYCYPASWGEAEFWVNGLRNTAWTKIVRTFTNASGYTETYNIYRTDTIQFGTGIQIEVR